MNDILKRWSEERRGEDRDRIVVTYSYLCVRAARRFYRPGVERSDLQQIGAIGLLKACDRYDPQAGTPFEAFAWLLIVGELMHYVRDQERLVRIPRKVRLMERRCSAASEELTGRLGRDPTASEIAAFLQVRRSDVEEIQCGRSRAFYDSLDSIAPRFLERFSYTMESREEKVLVDDALRRLSDVERKIILAVYATGYTQQELASKLGYSRRHISRLHRAALKKMQHAFVS